jgi:hypothetical protein
MLIAFPTPIFEIEINANNPAKAQRIPLKNGNINKLISKFSQEYKI